jgi:hypothetical protein
MQLKPPPLRRRATQSRANPDAIQVGEVTGFRQKVLRRAGASINGMSGQSRYVLECQRPGCGHTYCEEGIRVRRRRCPQCDGGEPGLPVPTEEKTLFDIAD